MGRVVSINVSQGGVPKLAVDSARVTRDGVAGDRQRNLKYHGGRDRAVSLFAMEIIAELQVQGHPIAPGTTGENLTIEGLDWALIVPGDQLRVGRDVALEITDFAKPCRTIASSFADGAYGRISHGRHPGRSRLYARVVSEGLVSTGDVVDHVPRTRR